jgi:hypothetical protein
MGRGERFFILAVIFLVEKGNLQVHEQGRKVDMDRAGKWT